MSKLLGERLRSVFGKRNAEDLANAEKKRFESEKKLADEIRFKEARTRRIKENKETIKKLKETSKAAGIADMMLQVRSFWGRGTVFDETDVEKARYSLLLRAFVGEDIVLRAHSTPSGSDPEYAERIQLRDVLRISLMEGKVMIEDKRESAYARSKKPDWKVYSNISSENLTYSTSEELSTGLERVLGDFTEKRIKERTLPRDFRADR